MNSWLTGRQQLLIERTLRVLGHCTVILVAALMVGTMWEEYSPPHHGSSFDPEPPLSAFENVTTMEIFGAVVSSIGEGASVGLLGLLSIPFYWLAHFLRLGREDKPEGANHKGASA